MWLNDAGGVRGSGTIARLGADSFLLVSAVEDCDWIADAAALYDVTVRDVSEEEGVLALIGPAAGKMLAAAGLETELAPLALRKFFWRGLDVTLSRFGDGYELWCDPDDALIVWDRIVGPDVPSRFARRASARWTFSTWKAASCGPAAISRRPATASRPSRRRSRLGLGGLVDRDHLFNGRAGAARSRKRSSPESCSTPKRPRRKPLSLRDGHAVGRTLGSLVSPALRRAIALAVLDRMRPRREPR